MYRIDADCVGALDAVPKDAPGGPPLPPMPPQPPWPREPSGPPGPQPPGGEPVPFASAPRRRLRRATLYVAFAVVATVVNLATQRIVLGMGPDAALLMPAIAAGTLAGLVVKYWLDKRYIFADFSTGFAAHGRRFGLYSLMGLVTTAIFWGTEAAFWAIWGTHAMRETGAILGLSVGYWVKYRLDRAYVFAPEGSAQKSGS
jgi:putative flippase GtrA